MPARPDHPDATLLASLEHRFDAELRTALAGARNVALVNFPNHNNPGDSAIWLGARAALKRLGVRVRYMCAWNTFNADALGRALPDGPVLLNGGGNFGDLYKGQQGLRERLLAELPHRHLIQLPQSIHFREQGNLERVRRLVAGHGNVTLMLREQTSFDLASKQFDAPVLLAPDCALALGRLPRPVTVPDVDLLWLHRLAGDPEYVDHGSLPTPLSVREVEWLRTVPPEPAWSYSARAGRKANGYLAPRCRADIRWGRHAWRPLAATFAPLGWGYVARGLQIMARGRVLVTDKLHGHLMALLAGIPHVVLDNSYGKVSGTYRTWTQPSFLARWAQGGEEAVAQAVELLSARPA